MLRWLLLLPCSAVSGRSDERDLPVDTWQRLLRQGWLQHAGEACH
ncbi:hypothetical protein ACF8C6_11255 [Pseudomonas sp. zbq_18]